MTKLMTKISLSNFQPKGYLGLMYPADADVQGPSTIKLGTIIGTATGIKEAVGADGVTVLQGAKGNFAIDFAPGADGKTIEGLQSGVCYLPEAFMDPILAMFSDQTDPETGEVTRPGAKAVDFAYDVSMIKAGNAAKYSWQLTPLLQTANDPIAAVRQQIAQNREEQAKLASAGQQPKLEAPEPVEGAKSKK